MPLFIKTKDANIWHRYKGESCTKVFSKCGKVFPVYVKSRVWSFVYRTPKHPERMCKICVKTKLKGVSNEY